MKKLLIVLIILIMNFSANSQQYITQKITNSDGLPGRNIYAVDQDEDNNIWVASENGIAFFDGLNWHKKRKCPGYFANVYFGIKFDKHGKMWAVGAFQDIALVSLENDKLFLESKFKLPLNLQKRIKGFSLLYDSKDNAIPVILLNDFGILVYKNKNWIKLGLSKELPSLNFYSLTNNNEYIYIVHSKGITKLDASLKLYTEQFHGLTKSKNVRGIFVDHNDHLLWFVDKKNLYKVSGNSIERIYTLKNGYQFDGAQIINYLKDEFIASANGQVLFFNNNRDVEYILDGTNGLLDATINDILLDNENVLWTASYRGLSKLIYLDFVFYNKNDGLVDNDIASIEQISDSLYFLGSREGYTIYNVINNSFKNYKPESLKGGRITDCAKINGEIWIAAEQRGVLKLTAKGNLESILPTRGSYNTVSICEDDKGGFFFSNSFYLMHYYHQKVDTLLNGKDLGCGYIRKVIKSDESIFLCTSEGLFKSSDLINWKHIFLRNSGINNIFDYYADDIHGELVASSDGLFTIQGDSLIEAQIDIGNNAYDINKDLNGDIWFSTSRGVYRLIDDKVIHYNLNDGFPFEETNRNAFCNTSNELILFGTEDGLAVFNRKYDRFKLPFRAKVKISSANSMGKSLDFRKEYEMDYDMDELNYEFYVKTSAFPRDYKLYTMLTNYDNNWRMVNSKGNGSVSYVKIPFGDHVFMIKAVDELGRETEIIKSGKIFIHQPFYKTNSFFAILAGVIFVLFWLFISYSEKNKYQKEAEEKIKIMEENLKEQNLIFDAFFHQSKSIFLLVDVKSQRIENANNAALEFYGYSLKELKGKMIRDLFQNKNAKSLITTKGEFVKNCKDVHILANGEKREVELFSSTMEYSQNPKALILVHDRTSEKKLDEEIKQTKELYQTLVDKMQDGLYMISDEKIKRCNKAFADILGYTTEELIGVNYTELVAERSLKIVKERYEKRRRGENVPAEYQLWLNHKSGSEVLVNMTVTTINLSGELFTFGIIKDITEMVEKENKLKESEERYRSIFENNAIGMYRTTPDGQIIMANDAFAKMLGFSSKDDLLNLNLESGEVFLGFNRKEFKSILERKGQINGFENKLIRMDGTEIYVRESAKAFYDEKGNVNYYEGVIEDITQLYIAQQELSLSEQKLQKLISLIADAVFELSPMGTIFNSRNEERAKEIFGIDSFNGRNILTLLPEEDRTTLVEILPEIISGIRPSHTIYFEHRNNGNKYFFKLKFVKYETSTLLAVLSDVSDTKKLKE